MLSLLNCCRATEYFVFLLTVIIIINIPSACLYSCHCYTARKSHICAQYCIVICDLPQSATFFSHFLTKKNDFRKNFVAHKMYVFIFLTFASSIYHSMKNSARYNQKRILVFMLSTGYSCHTLIKHSNFLERFPKNFRKSNSAKNPSRGNRIVLRWQKDGETDVRNLIVNFRKSANAPGKKKLLPWSVHQLYYIEPEFRENRSSFFFQILNGGRIQTALS